MTMPKKSKYRQHAHANPFSVREMTIPSSPSNVNLPAANYVDVGCGYGRFLLHVAKTRPDKVVYGLEIRKKVYEFVRDKIAELRKNGVVEKHRSVSGTESKEIDDTPANTYEGLLVNGTQKEKVDEQQCIRENGKECVTYENAHVIRTNAMLFFLHFFKKRSLEKIFVLYPDPHFKNKKRKARMVTLQTIQCFDYCLAEHGRVYISTDVKELFTAMIDSFSNCAYFKRLSDSECCSDEFYDAIQIGTDESKRAGARALVIYSAIYEKRSE
ncbi:Methyltransferase-like protein [Trachipleistophora hominis]|uniref:tRNA (guanine-N(7)-)-methyltransferase n=1 Tax=Trachipleistophora hominis TaxID=72359 RepID=L7JT57_TRAHO|nr:Methyltransferase-like protein [Trachipleistophora hominis]